MYSTEEMPTDQDWKDVQTHVNTENWYYEQVENNVIASFNVTDYLPDNTYLIKVEVVTDMAEHYDYRFSVNIDRSPPVYYGNYGFIRNFLLIINSFIKY